MITARIASLVFAAAVPALAADGWSSSAPEHATRQVTVTLSYHSRTVEVWVLPVAKDAPLPANHVQSKWIAFSKDRPKDVPQRVFSDTWLGSVDAGEAWVR